MAESKCPDADFLLQMKKQLVQLDHSRAPQSPLAVSEIFQHDFAAAGTLETGAERIWANVAVKVSGNVVETDAAVS